MNKQNKAGIAIFIVDKIDGKKIHGKGPVNS